MHCRQVALKPSALLPPPCAPFPFQQPPVQPIHIRLHAGKSGTEKQPPKHLLRFPGSSHPAAPAAFFMRKDRPPHPCRTSSTSVFPRTPPKKAPSSAPLLGKHQSSPGLHPPRHAFPSFMARSPSPLPGTPLPPAGRSAAYFI